MTEKKTDVPNYEVIVLVKNGKYFCRIPELSLLAKGDDLESSYQKLMDKKEEFIKEVEEYQDEGEFTPPSTTWFREGRGQHGSSITKYGFMDFLIKAGVVGLMALVILNIASSTIGGEISSIIDNSLTKGGRQIEKTFSSSLSRVDGSLVNMVKNVRTEIKKSIPSRLGRKFENELYKAVDHPIDAEREEKIVKSIRVVVNRLKPFAKELRPLLEDFGLADK